MSTLHHQRENYTVNMVNAWTTVKQKLAQIVLIVLIFTSVSLTTLTILFNPLLFIWIQDALNNNSSSIVRNSGSDCIIMNCTSFLPIENVTTANCSESYKIAPPLNPSDYIGIK